MVQGETPVVSHEELTGNAYDDIRFQRVIVEEMGELLPGKLLATCDLTHARSVLEIGCGAGGKSAAGPVNGCAQWRGCIPTSSVSVSIRTCSW